MDIDYNAMRKVALDLNTLYKIYFWIRFQENFEPILHQKIDGVSTLSYDFIGKRKSIDESFYNRWNYRNWFWAL